MTDREMLEMAAKAAELKGFISEWVSGPFFVVPADPDVPRSEPQIYDWINDDADALRLAVKLEILVLTARGFAVANSTDSGGTVERIPSEPDPYAATRRAIVRAAAAIGKSTP
jgi:hypothetical protein